ncbi:hypothetical protein ACU4GD_38180 [Cupriavidus basilensis]
MFLAIGGGFRPDRRAAPAAPTPAPAPGMDGGHHHMEPWRRHVGFKSIDTDGDGAISKAEADALFNKIDTNHDGKLDKNRRWQRRLITRRTGSSRRAGDAGRVRGPLQERPTRMVTAR